MLIVEELIDNGSDHRMATILRPEQDRLQASIGKPSEERSAESVLES